MGIGLHANDAGTAEKHISNPEYARSATLFPGLNYAEAVARVMADSAMRYRLRARIRKDQLDPVDCAADAEILLALNALRLIELLEQACAHDVH